MSRSRGLSLLYVAPFLLGVVWLLAPVITGGETLFMRDVFNTHLEMKWFQAEAMSSGSIPLVDPSRSGGQPHLGNPNTVPLYPDNLLYLVASPIWALNAHFWLHLLLAPVAFFYLARQWGLSREAAWASGVIYATGGFYLSTMNLYNLTAGVTLAPAFIAAWLGLASGKARGRTWVAGSLLWALLLLGGDPMTAAVALAAALAAVVVARGWRGVHWASVVWATVLGSLVAAPQLVEFLRILPGSYRGVQGYSVAAATVASWSPANALELVIPMAFGEPTLLYWGERFHAGRMPLLHSFYPGLIAIAAMIVGLRGKERPVRWTWVVIGTGVFLAMGSYNPVAEWLLGLPGMQVLRLPAKLWLLVAIGTSLLAGIGLDRLIAGGPTMQLRRTLVVIAAGIGAVALGLWAGSTMVAATIGGWMPRRIPPDFAVQEVARWARACGISALLTALAAALVSRPRVPRPILVGGLLAVHVVGQVSLLAPLLPTDSVEPYIDRSPLLDQIPADARVVHGDAGGLFGPEVARLADFEGADLKWLQRDTAERLYPPAGMLAGRRYEFWLSPEGLDSFLARRVSQALELVDDSRRMSLLEASGVTHLLLSRELEGVDEDRVELASRLELRSGPLHLYRLLRSAADVQLVGRVLRAIDPRSAVAQLMDATFDPRVATVIASEGTPVFGGGGEVEVIDSDNESLHLRVRSQGPGAVVIQRSYLPIYSAELDGGPVDIVVANMHRMAVEVPDGEHELRLWADRGSVLPATLVALLGLVLIGLQARRVSSPSATAVG